MWGLCAEVQEKSLEGKEREKGHFTQAEQEGSSLRLPDWKQVALSSSPVRDTWELGQLAGSAGLRL